MFKIKNIELKNFIGLRKINDKEGVFRLSIEDDMNKEIIMIFGENGLGKTTLLENLTPYSNMLSRDVKDSVDFPAHKKITFVEDGSRTEYRFEIHWESSTQTKGFIYVDNEILGATAKGNITEYNFEVEKMFGDFSKFKNSLFLQQGVLDIVKAKPSERVKIINAFMSELDIYNEIKENAVSKIEILKSKMEDYKEKVEELKTFENRYVDLKKFEEEFDYEEFEKEKIHLLDIEKDYLEISNKFSVKENLEKELVKTEEALNNFKNIDLEKQISEVDTAIARVEDELKNKESAEKLHSTLLGINNKRNEKTNILRELAYLSPESTNSTLERIKTENIGREAAIKGLEKEEEYLRKMRESIQNHITMSKILNEMKTERSGLKEELLRLKEEEVEKPEAELENVYLKLGEIETEGKSLRKSKDEKDNLTLQIENINKKMGLIHGEEKKLLEDVEKYQKVTIEQQELSELRTIVVNTDEEHKCQSCGQNVDIEIIKKKIDDLEESISKIDKDVLLDSKNKLEFNQKEIIKLERERELKTDALKELNKDYGKLLEETRSEYIRTNAIKEKIIAYNKHFERITPLKDKIQDLDRKIVETESRLEKPELGLEGVDSKLASNKAESEKTHRELARLREDEKILSRCEVEGNKNVADVIVDAKEAVSKLEMEEAKAKAEYEVVSAGLKEAKNLSEKRNFLNEENAKYKNTLLKSIELKDGLREFVHITKEKVDETKRLYATVKDTIEKKNIRLVEYKKDLELVNIKLDEYKKIKADSQNTENELYLLGKIKNYSDRIKKASISEFFNSISAFINKIISSEKGTLSDMKLRISQKNNAKSFDILVDNGGVDVKDISLLSGAEQGTVARAIYFALAQFSNFGIIWLDECDGMLSETNKEVFIEMLIKMKEMIGLNQIFLISHNKNLIYKTDLVIDLNAQVEAA